MTAATSRAPKVSQSLLALECISLPISEATTGARRLDAEVYLSEGFLVRREIAQSHLETERLGDLAKVRQPSRLAGIEVGRGSGAPYLMATQVFDLWPKPRRWLAEGKIAKPDELYVEPGWILVTRSGTVGNVVVTYAAHIRILISDDLLRVEVHEESLRGYVYSFLRTRYGRAVMRSSHYGNVIKHLEAHHLDAVDVPMLESLVEPLQREIESVFADREEAYLLEAEARSLFGEAVGSELEVEPEESFVVRASELFSDRTRRLDAQCFNPAAEAALKAIRDSGRKVEPLKSLVRTVFGVPRFKHVYAAEGIPYLDSEPLFKINPEQMKFIPPATKRDADKYLVKQGWLLMACSGQLYGLNGSVVIATRQHENKIVSNHVLRIIPTQVRVGYLKAALEHPELGEPLVLRHAFGTEVPEIAPDDVLELPIVRLPRKSEDEIADRMERASELRIEADEKENAAVGRLEAELARELEKSRGKKPALLFDTKADS